MRKLFIGLLGMALVFGWISGAVCAQKLSVEKTVLDNGLTVLISDMPHSTMVSVYALVKAGSATEGEFLGAGISHFLEHMLFKGTDKRSSQEIPSEIQSVGGTINASTGKDYAIYTITVPYEAFDVALDVLSDMVMNSKLDPVEFAKEREVILNEMRLHNDNPSRKLQEITNTTVFIRHPYKDPIIGYEDYFKKISQEDMMRYYKKFYVPNNIILSVAGRIEDGDIIKKIKEKWGGYPRGASVVRNLPAEPQQISSRRYEETYPTELSRMTISFPSVSLLNRDLYALDVLAKVLGQGKTSRLYKDIYRDKQLAYSISAYNYTPVDKGIFRVGVLFDYPNAAKIEELVGAHIADIQQDGVAPEELETAKRKVLSEYVFANQTSGQVAYARAVDEAFAGDYCFSEKYVDAIRNVSNADIRDVAQRYLRPEAMNIVILKPLGTDQSAVAPQQKPVASDITRVVLDNGLTLVLRDDPTFPLVSMRVTLNGGLLQESKEMNGISQLMATVWPKGSENLSFEEISQLTDSRGMRLGAYSGKYTYGLNVDCLAGDIDVALDLAEELIKYPLFNSKEIAQAKEDTLAEIKSLDDSIFAFTDRKMKKLLHPDHPLRYDVQGTAESIARIRREDVQAFYRKWTYPENMVVSVFGDFDLAQLQKSLTERFATLSDKPVELARPQAGEISAPIEKEYALNKEQVMLMWGFRGVEIGDPDQYTLEVATSILGSSLSGRLFNAIREELGEAYTLGAYSLPGQGTGSVKIYVLTNTGAIARVKQIVRAQIERLQTEPVPTEELDDVKAYLKGTFKASIQTNGALAFNCALDELYGFGYDHYKEYDALIDQVTPQDIRRAARTYMDLDKALTVITKPVTEEGAEE